MGMSKHGKDPERAERGIRPREVYSGAAHADLSSAEEKAGKASMCVSPGSSQDTGAH